MKLEKHYGVNDAAAYLRELGELFPTAANQLKEAAAHYDREIAVVHELDDLSREAEEAGGFTAETRADAQELVTAALQAERDAIADIEAALAILGKQH